MKITLFFLFFLFKIHKQMANLVEFRQRGFPVRRNLLLQLYFRIKFLLRTKKRNKQNLRLFAI